jgi:hypothetical protein
MVWNQYSRESGVLVSILFEGPKCLWILPCARPHQVPVPRQQKQCSSLIYFPLCRTNIAEPSTLNGYSTSRGSLVSSFLLSRSTHPLQDEIGTIVPQDASYAGFNLLLLEPVRIETTTAPIGSIASISRGARNDPSSSITWRSRKNHTRPTRANPTVF